jgi:hypothetical protein
MLRVGLIKHHCPFRAVAAAVSGTHIIAHLPFLPFLSERSSVGCFEEINGNVPEADFWPVVVRQGRLLPKDFLVMEYVGGTAINAKLGSGLRVGPLDDKDRDYAAVCTTPHAENKIA